MNTKYKTDEKVLKNIITRNVKCQNENGEVQLIIYYKNPKVKNLLMRNNPTQERTMLKSTNVIYEYSYPKADCKLLQNVKYVGMTTTDLSRRLTCHIGNGAPKTHMKDVHDETQSRENLVQNTVILKQCPDKQSLQIYEPYIFIKLILP